MQTKTKIAFATIVTILLSLDKLSTFFLPVVSHETEKTVFSDEFLCNAVGHCAKCKQQQPADCPLPRSGIVLAALDNTSARYYLDIRCIANHLPLFESGTLGVKGHVQVSSLLFSAVGYASHRLTLHRQSPTHARSYVVVSSKTRIQTLDSLVSSEC